MEDTADDIIFHNKPGRPKKHKTEEEKKEAKNKSRREWGRKNKVRLRKYNNKYYNANKIIHKQRVKNYYYEKKHKNNHIDHEELLTYYVNRIERDEVSNIKTLKKYNRIINNHNDVKYRDMINKNISTCIQFQKRNKRIMELYGKILSTKPNLILFRGPLSLQKKAIHEREFYNYEYIDMHDYMEKRTCIEFAQKKCMEQINNMLTNGKDIIISSNFKTINEIVKYVNTFNNISNVDVVMIYEKSLDGKDSNYQIYKNEEYLTI